MRVHACLVVVSVGLAQCLGVALVEGASQDTAPEAVHGDAVIVTETPRDQLATREIVNVRVYRSPDVTGDVLRAALNLAEATFVAASVNVVWKVCGPAECNTPPSPTEFLVRMVRSSQGGSGDPRCLGDTLIDVQKGTGVLATVYVNRVLDLAGRLGVDLRTLLGRTIAHEIGHLLLATNAHGTSGLMREVWLPDELLSGRADDWVLHPFEAAAIRQRLTMSRTDDPSSTL